MRPARKSILRQPLDAVLGTVSSVRVLRELTRHGQPLSPSDLASRTSLSKTSVGNALSDLVEMQVIEPVGTGWYVDYRIRRSHFLAGPIRELFRREADRVHEVLEGLHTIAEEADPAPEAVWLYGSVARGEDRPESDLDIVVVAADPSHRPALDDHFREDVLDLADRWGVTPSVIVVTLQEMEAGIQSGEQFYARIEEDALPVYGRPPHRLPQGG